MLVSLPKKPTPFLLAFLLSTLCLPALAQQLAPSIVWQKSFGGSGNEYANSIVRSVTGGFIIAGSSTSNDGDVTGHHGAVGVKDGWMISLAADGSMQWQRSLGGSAADDLVGQLARGIYLLFLYDAGDGHLIRSIKLVSVRKP
jgi:hypothetical protein